MITAWRARLIAGWAAVLAVTCASHVAATAAGALPMKCNALVSAEKWSYCFQTVTGTPTTYRAVRTRDGVHWATWDLSLQGMTGELKVQFFGRVGTTWYLQEYAAGLFSSPDGHAFTPVDPMAGNGQLMPSEAVTGTLDGKPALWLANSGGVPAAVPDGMPALPVAGFGNETDMFVPTPSGSMLAIGRPPGQVSSIGSPLSVASCDGFGQCLTSPTSLPTGMTAIEAVAPVATPRVVIVGNTKASAVYVVGSTGLKRSAALTRTVSSLQPGAAPRQYQMGWAAASATDWFVRITWVPDMTSAVRPAPGDLLFEGNPATDQWRVKAFAPSDESLAYRNVGGTRAPWLSSPCNQPLGSAMTWSQSAGLIVQVCNGVGGRAFRSTDRGLHWATIR